MFRACILGAAAGSGLHQWNRGCDNFNLARAGAISSQTKSAIVINADGDERAVSTQISALLSAADQWGY